MRVFLTDMKGRGWFSGRSASLSTPLHRECKAVMVSLFSVIACELCPAPHSNIIQSQWTLRRLARLVLTVARLCTAYRLINSPVTSGVPGYAYCKQAITNREIGCVYA